MKTSVKIFVIIMCVLVIIGLGCIGVGVVLGGDFTAVLNDIFVDLYARIQGTFVETPVIK